MARTKIAKTPKAESLLIELLMEELPPKSVRILGDEFANGILHGLNLAQLRESRASMGIQIFATPRRLAMTIPEVLSKANDRVEPKELMPAKVAFDESGRPSTPLIKRLEKEGLGLDAIKRRSNEEGVECVFIDRFIPGL